MTSDSYDLIVIGAGPAGEKGAAQAAYFGRRVALVERAERPGGACTNTGTLPSKTLREAALHLSGLATRGLEGVELRLDRALAARSMRARMNEVRDSEHARIQRNIARHGIDLVPGTAAFADATTVRVTGPGGERLLRAPVVMVATGSSPHRPREVPFEPERVWDSDTVLELRELPRSLTVVGAGVIGSEYACIFAALGVEVQLLDGRDRAMPFLDGEIAGVLTREMERLGVRFRMPAKVAAHERRECSVVTRLEGGGLIETDALLFAAGRSGNTRELGLEAAGVTPNSRGHIPVDEHYRTVAPSVYAAGDVIGFPALASTSMDQGRLAVCHALGLTYRRRLAEHLPMGIYTIPEVSAVGLTEEEARAKGIDVEVGRADFAENARAEIMGSGGLLKLVFEAATLKLLGVHIVCERASEVVAPGHIALQAGLGIDTFVETVFNYPTLSEAYKYAAYDGLGRLKARGRETGRSMR